MATDDANLPGQAEVQVIHKAWEEFGLDALRPIIDRQALSMKAGEERRQKARVKLREQIQSFKQLQDAEQDKTLIDKPAGDVIKSFQNEVDELTRRSKADELYFRQVYSKLYQAPDPVRVLYLASLYHQEKGSSSSLRAQLEQSRAEVEKSKAQKGKISILEDRVKELEQKTTPPSSAELDAQAREFEDERTRITKEAEDRQQYLQQEVERYRDLLLKTQGQVDELQSRLFSIHDRKDKEDASQDDLINRTMEELQEANTQITVMKQKNAELNMSLMKASDMSTNEAVVEAKRQASQAQHRLDLVLRDYNTSLEQLEELRSRIGQEESSKTLLQSRHERELHKLEAQIGQLQETISGLPSLEEFDAIKNELRMQQVAKISTEDSHFGGLSQHEQELLEKTQELEAETTRMRIEQLNLKKQLEDTEHQLQSSLEQNAQSLAMTEMLERNLTDSEQKPSSEASVPGKSTSNTFANEVVTFQRDRYKKAVQALETEKRVVDTRCHTLALQLATLQKDNENLYQRLHLAVKDRGVEGERVQKGSVDSRYVKLFDDHPPRGPIGSQSQHGVVQLNVMEKVILNSARMFLGNKTLRTVSFFYVVALHALVFFSLVTHTFMSHCSESPSLHHSN